MINLVILLYHSGHYYAIMKNMGTIYIMRHGECLDNARGVLNGRRDTGLTELGKKQARAAANQLKSAKIKIIFSSPLKRTHQTAALIKKELGLSKVMIEPDLLERDVGKLGGLPSAEAQRRAAKVMRAGHLDYILAGPSVESFAATYRRARRVWKKLRLAAKKGDNVLAITHGDLSMMLRAVVRGWTWRRGLVEPYLENGEIIILRPS